MHPFHTRRLTRVERGLLGSLAGIAGIVLILSLLLAAYDAYRFSHDGVVADARILGSDTGCFGAYGSGTGIGGPTITYLVEFPVGSATHRTHVVRPCDVIPPDFGRGRGSIWVQYDRQDPDRIRVLNDRRAETRVDQLSVTLVGYVVVGAALFLGSRVRHRRRSFDST